VIDRHAPVAKRPAPGGFHPAAETTRPRVGKSTVDVPLLRRVGEDGRPSQLLQPSQIARVIEMTVRQQDRLDVRPTEPDIIQRQLQARQLPYQPGVDQDSLALRLVVEQMKRPAEAVHRMNPKSGGGFNMV